MIFQSFMMLSQSAEAAEIPLELTFWDGLVVLFSFGILFAFVGSAVSWGRLLWRGQRFFGPSALIPSRPRHQPFWNPFDFVVFYGILFVASIVLVGIFQTAGWLEIAGDVETSLVVADAAELNSDNQPAPAAQEPASGLKNEALGSSDPEMPRSPEFSLSQIAISSLATMIAAVVMIAVLKLRCNDVIERMGLLASRADVALGLRSALLILPPTMLMMGAVSMLREYSHPVLDLLEVDELGGSPSLLAFGMLFVTTAFVAPVVEEFWFRGLLQGGLQSMADSMRRRRLLESTLLKDRDSDSSITGSGDEATPSQNPYEPSQISSPPDDRSFIRNELERDAWVPVTLWPLILASLVFALAHWGHGLAPIPLFFLSLGLGYLYRQTGSLIPSITVHFVLNGLTMTLTFFELMRGSS